MREIDSLMDYATLVAPIDGTVSQILARPGDLATPGKALVHIVSSTGLYLNLSLPETLRASEILHNGTLRELTSKNKAGVTGLVQYVAPLPGDHGLVEGQYLAVSVVVHRANDVLIPMDALLTMDGSTSVFELTAEGKAVRRPVNITFRGVEGVTVAEDLSGRTVIIAKPDILLRISAGVPAVIDTGNKGAEHV
jgi:multidrug efflux pump subunit AcrA (membrane-fusion protein)